MNKCPKQLMIVQETIDIEDLRTVLPYSIFNNYDFLIRRFEDWRTVYGFEFDPDYDVKDFINKYIDSFIKSASNVFSCEVSDNSNDHMINIKVKYLTKENVTVNRFFGTKRKTIMLPHIMHFESYKILAKRLNIDEIASSMINVAGVSNTDVVIQHVMDMGKIFYGEGE